MKTQTEIVLETLQFYLEDPKARRSKSAVAPTCYYRMASPGEVPRHCALGRCMTDEALDQFGNFVGGVGMLETALGDTLDTLLREEYRGHSQEFWTNLQALHDRDYNWLPGDDGAGYLGEFFRYYFPDAVPAALELNLIK